MIKMSFHSCLLSKGAYIFLPWAKGVTAKLLEGGGGHVGRSPPLTNVQIKAVGKRIKDTFLEIGRDGNFS